MLGDQTFRRPRRPGFDQDLLQFGCLDMVGLDQDGGVPIEVQVVK